MITKLRITNFKSFSDIVVDFTDRNGSPKPLVLIYGENGAGKSNLLLAILFFAQTLDTFVQSEQFAKAQNDLDKMKSEVNDEPDNALKQSFLNFIINNRFFTLPKLLKQYRQINSKGLLELEIGFKIDGACGTYYSAFDETKLVKESLSYRINKKRGTVFDISEKNIKINKDIFSSTYKTKIKDLIGQYWGKHTFLSILNRELASYNGEFIEKNYNSNLLKWLEWSQSLSVRTNSANLARIEIPIPFMKDLESGSINNREDEELLLCERMLRDFYTGLYSDVKDVYYEFTAQDDGFRYQLYFEKIIDGRVLKIPFSLESTGTKKLLEIFPSLLSCVAGKTVFIDEIDSGIHDLLMKKVVEALEESINGQCIVTTHNTLLLESLPQKYIYIISSDVNGQKSINCISDYNLRTQQNNNIRNKYLRGDYEGVPYPGVIDFSDFLDDIETLNHN